MEYNFQVGDLVTFELEPLLTRPRWNHSESGGASGMWGFGKVAFTEAHRLYVDRYEHSPKTNQARRWHWPLPGCNTYKPEQWARPGYLRLLLKYDFILYEGAEITCSTSK